MQDHTHFEGLFLQMCQASFPMPEAGKSIMGGSLLALWACSIPTPGNQPILWPIVMTGSPRDKEALRVELGCPLSHQVH